MYKFEITPVSKPRQTQSDKWKQRPVVMKYRGYADHLRLLANTLGYVPEDVLSIHFYLPMPKSWSKKKRALMVKQPHRQKPDLDNLIKAFQDALLSEDSHIHTYSYCCKVWAEEGQILVFKETDL
jgi:Holliday junction resolvase RusA-like endonuclease